MAGEETERLMSLTVRLRDRDRWIEFAQPRAVLRAYDAHGAAEAFDACERAMAEGAWIAGYLSYELGAAFVREPLRPTVRPLLSLGIFGAPRDVAAPEASAMVSPLLRTVDEDRYAHVLEAIQRAIYDGDVYQVNYTVPFHLALRGNPASFWHAVAATTAAPYQAYVEEGDACVLSWSPELFLAFDGTRIETRPMKGTASLDDLGALRSTKNLAEHVMIVDLLRNDLHRICTTVEVSDLCEVERYPSFATMTSRISGELRNGVALKDVFSATFPCGSVTGAPKRAAVATIAQTEDRPRDIYCGSIGFLSPQRRGWWNVAIRTAQCFPDGSMRFDAGGGIVSDSSAPDEWNEIRIKTAFLRSHTQAPELRETFAAAAAPSIIDAHLARLHASAGRLDIPYDEQRIRASFHDAPDDSLVRIRLAADGSVRCLTEPLEAAPPVVDVCIASARVVSTDPWLGIKSAWRPAHDAAMEEARRHACFDALLLNERGEVTEGSRTNIFVQIGATLHTPPLASGVLPGILRSRIVSEGRAVERVIHVDDLASADALFVGNSARGLIRARIV